MTTLTENWRRDLPPEWTWVPLRYVATLGTGHTPDRTKPEYWMECEIPWVTAADLSRRPTEFEPLTDTAQKISELGVANSSAVLHPAGTVMFCRTASVGLIAITGKPMATTQAFVTWTAGPRLIPRYLLYVVAAMRPELFRLAYGSTHLTIYMPDLAALRVPLPPVEEQRRIVDFLDDQVTLLDRAVGLRQQQVDLVNETSTAQIDELLRQGGRSSAELCPAEYTPFGLVPRSWKQGRLRSTLVEVQTGPFGSQLNAEEYVDGGWPIVNPSNITPEGRLVADHTVSVGDATRMRLARHVLQVGDVVFGRRGDLGRAGLVQEEQAGWLCGTGSLRVRFLEAAFNPAYLTRFLRLPAVRYYFESNSVGSTMQNLNTALLLGMPLLIPPVDEQREIADRADAVAARSERLARLLTRSVELLRERKQALITAAVTGQVDVATARSVA